CPMVTDLEETLSFSDRSVQEGTGVAVDGIVEKTREENEKGQHQAEVDGAVGEPPHRGRHQATRDRMRSALDKVSMKETDRRHRKQRQSIGRLTRLPTNQGVIFHRRSKDQ